MLVAVGEIFSILLPKGSYLNVISFTEDVSARDYRTDNG